MIGDESRSRRAFLALAGGGLSVFAGCSSAGGDVDGGPSTTATDPATATRTTAGANPPTAEGEATTTAPQETTTEVAEETTSTSTEDRSDAVERMASALASVTFEGDYVDTHAHWLPSMGREIPSRYAPVMEEYDIGATVLFSPSALAAREYESFLERLTGPGVEFLPFMSAPSPGRRIAPELRDLYDDTADAFWGIGEWKPQEQPFPPFDGDRYTPLWELSADLDIPVMFHPKASQDGTVEPALKSHDETTFVLHGHQMLGFGRDGPGLGPTLPRLLREYDNLYWQMDVGVMLGGRLLRLKSASAFVDWYESNASELVGIYQDVLSDLLDAAPGRIMWGTDIARPWNLEDDSFSLLVEFTEKVLDGVPEEHHAPYKRENALELFDI